MGGLRGVHHCPAEDLVWGTLGFEMLSFDDPPTTSKRYDAAAKVRVKVTPYDEYYAGTDRGAAPDWYVGETYQFPRSVKNTYQPASNSRAKFCLGSRAVYRDRKQVAVNYLFVGDAVLGGSGLVYWHQLDLETNTLSHFVLVQPDEEGDLGYSATLDTHERGNELDYYNPFGLFYYGYSAPDTPVLDGNWGPLKIFKSHNITVANSFPPYKSRPGAWQAGKHYLSFSGYINSDSIPESGRFGVVRYDNREGDHEQAWYAVTSTIWDPLIRFALVRPSIRSYLKGSDDDEPWWVSYDRATNTLGTGTWKARNGESLESEVQNTYELPFDALVGPNILCYNRTHDGRDLMIVRDAAEVFPGGAGGNRSNKYWMLDGEEFIEVEDAPSFITDDEDGNIITGNKTHVRKHGEQGWVHLGEGEFGDVDGSEWTPPDEPVEDDEDPSYNSPYEDMFFQMMCSKSHIHLRDFRGAPDLATASLTDDDWPDYVIANRANSRDSQAVSADMFRCWSFSYDGSIRTPHVQFHAAYSNDDERLRIHERMYVGHNPSEYQFIFDGVEDREWPKWSHSNFQNDWPSGMERFRPWLDDYGNTLGGIEEDVFIDHAWNFDFDIVGICDCCCPGTAVNY